MKKLVMATIVGGIVFFLWGGISHMVLGLGNVGIKDLPNDDALVSTLKTNISEAGFYFFPAMGTTRGMSADQKKAAMDRFTDKYKSGPYGILIYQPTGRAPMTAKQFLIELSGNFLQALFSAILLSFAALRLTSYKSRVLFVTGLGVLASISTNISYWNWYGFPGNYTGPFILDRVLAFFFMGLAMAAIVKVGAENGATAKVGS